MMSSEENTQIKQAMVPLGAILDTAAGKAGAEIFKIMDEYELPPSLMDYIMSTVILKIKELKASEYAAHLQKREETDG